MVLLLAAWMAQSFQLTAPPEASAGDLVSLRLTRDGAPLPGVALRVTAPAAEIGTVKAARLLLRDNRTTLVKGDLVLVTSVTGEDCAVILASGRAGVAPCDGLERRAFGQPLGTTDPDGRVLSRDLAAVPASMEIAAVRAGDVVATATVRVKPYTLDETSPLGEGITARSRRWVAGGEGPFEMHTVEVDPRRPDTFLLPVRAKDRAVGLEALTNLSRRYGALAAVNGAAFVAEPAAYAGASSGPYVWNGMVSAAGEAAAALYVCAGNRVAIQSAAIRARAVAADGQTLELAGVNRARGENEAVLYTPLMGGRTLTEGAGVEAQLDLQDRVNAVGEANAEIPFDGRVVSGQGTAAEFLRQKAQVGSRLAVEAVVPMASCAPADLIPSVVAEPDVRRPRAAFSVTDRGTWLLAVVDGDQASTAGMRQDEFERELAALGAASNVFLAGGAAAALTVADALWNSPSAGEERPVGDALLVFQVGDLSSLIQVMDRVASEPGQVSESAIDQLNTLLGDAVEAFVDGDTGGVRVAATALRDLVRKLDGTEMSRAAGRVLLRSTEAFLTTLPDVQPLRRAGASPRRRVLLRAR